MEVKFRVDGSHEFCGDELDVGQGFEESCVEGISSAPLYGVALLTALPTRRLARLELAQLIRALPRAFLASKPRLYIRGQ